MAADEVDLEPRAALVQLTRVQRYTAGLRWETEVGVDHVDFAAGRTGTSGSRSWHPLPMDCPLHDVPAGQASLWTALWQVACLMRPEWSPEQWRPRLRRLARIADGLTGHGNRPTDAASPGESAHRALNDRMVEWVRRLLPLSRMPTRGIQRPAIQVRETAGLDLETVEACRSHGGVALVAWRRNSDATGLNKTHPSNVASTAQGLQWRLLAGLEGFQSQAPVFQPCSMLLLPQGTEAVWGCGYGLRMDPVVEQHARSPDKANPWVLRSLHGHLTTAEVVKALMLNG